MYKAQVLVYFYCNEWKEYSSMNPRDVEHVYFDSYQTRVRMAEDMLKDTNVSIKDGYNTDDFIEVMARGDISAANDMLENANIFVWEVNNSV